ncbi:IS66-like element accessory protein TnpA [Piscinibacter koreensis]|uniref:Transposase n=1 Tax=Piscinibacter koreensis TaxID=2742824 RepID=A0A7Y6NTN5_9BURK|nr:transposase [Schlegelella koreensis]NUZ09130.1 transposase [Schlegelella koreensis]
MQDSGHTSAWTGQAVERTKSNGKRVFATAFKRWIVEEARRPGASVAGLAMQHGVNANQLHRWMRLPQWRSEAPVSPALPVLLPVEIQAEPAHVTAAPITARRVPIEVELGGAVVRVMPGVDGATLRMVLAALRG